jgi:hypothetical protein
MLPVNNAALLATQTSPGVQGRVGVNVDVTAGTVTSRFELNTQDPRVQTPEGSRISGNISGGPFAGATATLTEGRPGPDGRIPVTFSVTAEQGFRLNGQAGANGVTVGGGVQTGQRENATYRLNLTPEQLTGIQNGTLPFPNPADPTSIPVGSSFTARSEDFQGNSFNAAYRGIGIQSKMESAQGTSMGVERISDTHVRITTGPHDRVSQSLELGISGRLGEVDIRATLGATHALNHSRTQSVELDISTPEGRAAYQSFLETGQLPTEHPSARNAQAVETLEYNHALRGQLQLGSLGIGGTLNDTNGRLTIQETPDGTSYRYQGDARPDNHIDMQWTTDAQGNIQMGDTTLRLGNQLQGGFLGFFQSRPADTLAQMAGVPRDSDNLNLHMNQQGLQELRGGAIAHARHLAQHDYRVPPELRALANNQDLTNEQFMEQARPFLGENVYASRFPLDPMTDGLLRAQTPHQIANSLARMPTLDQATGQLAETFARYAISTPGLFDSPNLSIRP